MKIWYCPTEEWDCPYYRDGECLIDNPIEDCDCFYRYEEEEEEHYTFHFGK